MRTFIGLLAVVGAAWCGVPSAHAAFVSCGTPRAATLAQGAQSRVFSVRGDWVACTRGSTRRSQLGYDGTRCEGSSSGCGGIDRAAVAGRFVAFNSYDCCGAYGDQLFLLTVRDLASGRDRLLFRGGSIAKERAQLVGLVVRRTGTAAWLMTRGPQSSNRNETVEVRRSPGCGPTLLDAGDIDPLSLRRVGGRVSWRHSGLRRSAALC